MPRQGRRPELEYLCVDSFLRDAVDARALAAAFELGLIERLCEGGRSRPDDLARRVGADGRGLRLLLDLLVANGVVEDREGEIELSAGFRRALEYRDLLEAKLEFAHIAALDMLDGFTHLVRSPDRFVRNSRIYRLFCYEQALESGPGRQEVTRRWVRITTALTRYEAGVCIERHDCSRYRRMLDVGGNSGQFALEMCRRNPAIRVTVLDLPLVCQIGEAHVRYAPEADRIAFVRGNALADRLPTGFDLVTFKSMLHDWPAEEMKRLLAQAARSLEPGGTLLIFERGPLEIREGRLPYSMLPFLLFAHAFRSPDVYLEQMEELGFRDIAVQRIDLETPFFLVTGNRGP
jgi:SAM-dependent methyltransferase